MGCTCGKGTRIRLWLSAWGRVGSSSRCGYITDEFAGDLGDDGECRLDECVQDDDKEHRGQPETE